MAKVEAMLGDALPVFQWRNQNWNIIPGSATRRKDLDGGGFSLNADFRFNALVSQFISSTIPDATALKAKLLQTNIGYLGDGYRVTDVAILPGGYQITVDAASDVQNA